MSHISIDGVIYDCSERGKIAVIMGREDSHLPCNLTIPPEITCRGDRFTVIGIAQDAFDECPVLNYVTLPDTITWMESAFYNCENLRGVTLSKNLETLYPGTFGSCGNLEHVHIPEGVKVLGWYVFDWCINLTEVTLPGSLVEIQKGAFECCSRLKRIVIPHNVVQVGEDAFYGCDNLESVIFENPETKVADGDTLRIGSSFGHSLPEKRLKYTYRYETKAYAIQRRRVFGLR